MGDYVLDKCCGCIELKTGCFVIGYLSLVGYSILTLAFTVLLIMGVAAAVVHGAMIIIFCIFLLIVAIPLIFDIVLLVGLHKNKPGHVKAYLIYGVVILVLLILGFIGTIFKDGMPWGVIAGSFLYILLQIYFVLVIRSQYLVMRSPDGVPINAQRCLRTL